MPICLSGRQVKAKGHSFGMAWSILWHAAQVLLVAAAFLKNREQTTFNLSEIEK